MGVDVLPEWLNNLEEEDISFIKYTGLHIQR
ncbi:MAG: hypothetical protein K0Q47_1450 [Sedimentibacter sp.]|nr:hypothetical protein [Sedimentibacter sp.]